MSRLISTRVALLSLVACGSDDEGPCDPLLQWQDDASEDQYDIRVVDSFGNIIWTEQMTGINGGTAELTYAGPTLESGAYFVP